ncbi:MAG: hypothetical protein AAF570_20300, partial [Bacteroidota bacterium]
MSQTRQETVTLRQAKSLIKALAAEESLLLLSAPGIGKSDIVRSHQFEAIRQGLSFTGQDMERIADDRDAFQRLQRALRK